MKKKDLSTFQEFLRIHDCFVLTTHQGQDGDAVGSLLAFYQFLEYYGKEARVLLPGGLADRFLSLPASAEIKGNEVVKWDGCPLVVLDCAGLERALSAGGDRPSFVINIDHHITNSFFGNLNLVDAKASSTGEILAELFLSLSPSLPVQIWQCLFFAIYADTGGFSFENTSGKCLRIAAKLLERGTQPTVASQWFSRLDEKDLRVLGIVLSKMTYNPPVAYSRIPLSAEVTAEFDSDYIMNIWRLWPEPLVYVLFKEVLPLTFKVSMRSRQGLNLTPVAEAFGGGGHPTASGCTIQGPWSRIKKSLLFLIEEAITKWKTAS